ncbi:MAG: hypothetical protein JWQ97_56 [Phenylobacterium sp.]|nr:hypothetical protein [Phenylobacterium sp.]
MQISGNSDAYQATQVQRALSMLLQQSSGDAGQTQPGGTAGPTPAAPLPAAGPGDQFAAATLSGLLSVQQQPPSSADMASNLMSQADANGDGQLSADEIKQALGQNSSSSGDLTSAISKLDTNGDGTLSAAELTSGIDTARKTHHHHHQGAEASSASGQAQASTTASASAASADETSAAQS